MKILRLLTLVAVTALLTQCYPEGPEYLDEVDIVFSTYDPDYNFASRQTFSMPDKIMKIDEDLIGDNGINYVNEIYAAPMLEKIRQNMVGNGWTEVEIGADPDVLIAPAAYEMTTYYYGYDYWYYYDWWYGGYYPGGGWYYPYPVVEGYTTGSLIVNLVDPNEVSANDRPRVAWTFIVNGLLEGSTAEFTARYTKAIDQAFEQSPYLKN
ncbi:MAG: DUF4136 domain-containing protein [Lentimicrobium sp.]